MTEKNLQSICPIERQFDLSRHSTIGCGGYAEVAYFPQSIEQAVALITRLREEQTPFYTVGNMSNVLPKDGISKRVFVCMKGLKEMQFSKRFFGAGVTSGALLAACKKEGLSGIEFLEGIPCTLGGALFMNAGVQGGYVGDVVENVLIFDGEDVRVLAQKDCAYGYKRSIFMQESWTILGAHLRLQSKPQQEILQKLAFYRQRRAHLPKGKSMGCIFKNADGVAAAKYIEGAGLKGLRVGGAVVSNIHANFIINDNNATAQEIKTLMSIVKNAVYAQYKIWLEEEIRLLE